MKKRIFKVSCTFLSTGEKTYGFVKAMNANEAEFLFIKEVGMLHGKLNITQVVEVSEEEFKAAKKKLLKL